MWEASSSSEEQSARKGSVKPHPGLRPLGVFEGSRFKIQGVENLYITHREKASRMMVLSQKITKE